MGLTSKVLVLVILVCIVHTSDGWWSGRRRRRWFPPIRIPPIRIPPIRVPFFRKVGTFFVRVGKYVKKGFDILTKGCCGLHPSYCSNRKEFEKIKAEIKSKSALMDKDWVYVKKKLAQIKSVNHNNQVVFRNVRRVTLSSTLTVQTLDPSIIAKMNNVSNELKKAIKAKNDTVLDYDINKIGSEFEKTEEKSKTAILDATGIGGFALSEGFVKMSADMFKLVKLDGVAKFLTTEVGGFLKNVKNGINKLFGLGFLEKLAKTNKAAKVALSVLNFFNSYLNLAGGIFKIFELFGKLAAWITDLATCNKRKNEMEVNLRDIKKKRIDINAAYTKLQTNKKTVNTNWGLVFNEAKGEGLLSNLGEVQKIAEHSSSTSKKMQQCANIIANYRRSVARSTPDGVISLQKQLIDAASNISFNAECYQRKLATYKSVGENCKLGKGSFNELYIQAIKDFGTNSVECRGESGLPYTTKADVQKYMFKRAEKEGFEKNCLLNSGLKRAFVCNRLNAGYTLTQAASASKVNTTMAKLYQQSCQISEFSPSIKKTICLLKKYKSNSEMQNIFTDTDLSDIKLAISKCA